MSLLDERRVGEAEHHFEQAAARGSEDPRYTMGLALTALARGETSYAERLARRAHDHPGCDDLLADACAMVLSACSRSSDKN